MNPTPNTLSPQDNQPQKRRTNGSLSHLDKFEARASMRSHFSDEENGSGDENKQDILQMAKKLDRLKSSRQELVIKMSLSNKTLTMGKEQEISDIISARNTFKDTKEVSAADNSKSPDFIKTNSTGPSKPKKEEPKIEEASDDFDFEINEIIEEEAPRVSEPHRAIVHAGNKEVQTKVGTEAKIQTIPQPKSKSPLKPLGTRPAPLNLPTMEGFLMKKSTNLLGLWQRRYYALKDKKLYYYKSQGKEIRTGVVDFDLVSVKLEEGKNKREFKIIAVGGSRDFLLKAESEQERQKWVETLKAHIEKSKGHSVSLCKVVKMKRYWKDERITEQQFLDQAETGDILLFRTKNIGAKLQRSFTRSEYDHVGLILRYSTGEIVLFEATGKTGVGLCRWKTFVKCKWHLLYHKMVLRRLAIRRTDEVINTIEKFVRYSVGKKYQLTAQKLLKKKSATLDEEDRTFFCSELVAACYKKINLLPADVSAASYLPGSFSAEKNLKLQNNTKLGDEFLIEFEI